jgi:hypothetical protein
MWVIRVLSGDRRRPIVARTPVIFSFRASASLLLPEMTRHQSSAYLMSLWFGRPWRRRLARSPPVVCGPPGSSAVNSSRTERATLLSRGERIDPCGVPVSLSRSRPSSPRIPDLRNALTSVLRLRFADNIGRGTRGSPRRSWSR